ncbi:hypothetical protein mRhiFer1_009580 [Rhinolophus ferrumequinum]|uniref:Uncharacterized protein n=1 Tax=Rhinolophus ferrumequinum TaxID=59479 RepID=A0A7J7ZQ10_RHIFE|nr:hypothetical protein mRhiFer1_009580 [Rhinolophus ferrumequinum]
MHIPRRHIPGLNPAAPGAGSTSRSDRPIPGGGGEPRDQGKHRTFERKGVEELSAEGKGPANSEGTKAPPSRSLSLFGPEGGSGRWKSVKSTESMSVTRPGGVAPGASAGRLALRDLSPEASGLAAESEGGSLGPRAQRHACPSGPRGKFQPDPRRRLGPPPSPVALVATQDSPQGRGASPAGAGPATRAPCAARLRCKGFRTVGRGRIPYPVPSVQPPREVPHPEPAVAKKVWATRWRKSTAARKPGFPRPWMRL